MFLSNNKKNLSSRGSKLHGRVRMMYLFAEKFITRMEEEASKSGQKIFACDIMSLIELAETDDHVDLLTRLIKK